MVNRICCGLPCNKYLVSIVLEMVVYVCRYFGMKHLPMRHTSRFLSTLFFPKYPPPNYYCLWRTLNTYYFFFQISTLATVVLVGHVTYYYCERYVVILRPFLRCVHNFYTKHVSEYSPSPFLLGRLVLGAAREEEKAAFVRDLCVLNRRNFASLQHLRLMVMRICTWGYLEVLGFIGYLRFMVPPAQILL